MHQVDCELKDQDWLLQLLCDNLAKEQAKMRQQEDKHQHEREF